MKRIRLILMFIAVSLVAASCLKSVDPTPPLPYQKYIDWYIVVTAQNDAAMDPFYVAYKLNQFIYVTTQYPDDTNKATEASKKLFGNAQVKQQGTSYLITYSQDSGISGEPNRDGRLVIETNGKSLTDPEAYWSVTTQEDNLYSTNHGNGWISQKIISGKYNIVCDEDLKWQVTAYGIDQRVSNGYLTNWYIDFMVKQTNGSATEIGGDRDLEISTAPGGDNGGKAFSDGSTSGVGRYNYQILSPIYYSTKCDYPGVKAGGIQKISFMDEYGIMVKDFGVFDMGTEMVCNPITILTYTVDGVEKKVDLSTGLDVL